MTRKDTLRRQYSTLRVHRRPSTVDHHASPTEPSNVDLRRQYSTLRTHSPGPIERGRQAANQNVTAPHKPTEEEIAIYQPSFPTPFLSAATFHRADLKESEKIRNMHKGRLARRAYLRHSFNRMDFIAVVSYWIALVLELTGVMTQHHIYVFRMLSCLRIFRLLGITEGTSVLSTQPRR
jgi:voltage-dependent calcium channel